MQLFTFTRRLRFYAIGFGVILSGALAMSGLSATASAVVDNDPDCDNVAIIKCGVFTKAKMREKASKGDVPRVYNAFGIHQNELDGKFVTGIVWRDGRVTVDGKVVATNAMTAGRNYGGTPIPNTNNAGKYPTSKFVTEGQTAFVKMTDGAFDFAVIKSCGNPVSATPKSPPAPQEAPKDIKVCDLRTFEIVTIKESNFDKSKYSKNLDKCRKIKVCELATKDIITIKRGEFDATKHSKDLNDCAETPAPNMLRVCVIATGDIVDIKESEFDAAKHSKDLNVCNKEEETPETIADTGPEAVMGGLFGSGALGYGAYSYLQSRRDLLSKLLKR